MVVIIMSQPVTELFIFQARVLKYSGLLGVMRLATVQDFSSVSPDYACLTNKTTKTWGVNITGLQHFNFQRCKHLKLYAITVVLDTLVYS